MTDDRMSLDEDRALLKAWCQGDREAGDRLIRYQFDWISRSVLRWVRGDSAVAMDIVQATFEVALDKKTGIDGPFGPYVRGIARLKVLEHFRRKDGALLRELTTSLRGDRTSAESALLGAEQERLALAALRRLSAEQQDLMYLRYVQGMKLREIAELRGATIGTIDGILRRAEKQLAQQVERLAESPHLSQSTLVGIGTWIRRRDAHEPSGPA
ncbi:MAG: sigma-70 family RNA polymerase sigma factor [Myxococcota bacterium]